MSRLVVFTVVLFGTAAFAQKTWQDWSALGRSGDAAFKKGDFAAAERSYRAAVELGSTLRASTEIDPHLSAWVVSRAAQGSCETPPTATTPERALLALARGEAAEAEKALASVLESYSGPPTCRSTLPFEIMAFLRFSAGKRDEAIRFTEQLKPYRCKALRDDPLLKVISPLNLAWQKNEKTRWTAALPAAEVWFGTGHPLLEASGKALGIDGGVGSSPEVKRCLGRPPAR